ncbi:MAG TPA: hypothetical protein VFR85_04960 [Anaeromyxobacteraceae bacterium]|nr:hypothetical protein [Anaeromyxobacteraceae bacterium]
MAHGRRALLFAAVLAALLAPRAASAAACCLSATSFGVGRLLVWEEMAAGVLTGYGWSLGQWTSSGQLQPNLPGFHDGVMLLEPYFILRVSERIQVQAWVPFLFNDRSMGPVDQFAGGVGDIGAALRFEVLAIGEYQGLPSLAFTVGGLAPSGTRVEQTLPPLLAGTTGRGSWAASLGLEAEYAWVPWFLRVEAAGTWYFPFQRQDNGLHQQWGPLLQTGISTGMEVVPDQLVLALGLLGEWEAAYQLEGEAIPSSSTRSLSAALSTSWRASPHWTLNGVVTNSVWPDGLGSNRDARLGFTIGVRYGHF